MKALVWTMLVLFAALLPVEILADGRSSFSVAPLDRVQRFLNIGDLCLGP